MSAARRSPENTASGPAVSFTAVAPSRLAVAGTSTDQVPQTPIGATTARSVSDRGGGLGTLNIVPTRICMRAPATRTSGASARRMPQLTRLRVAEVPIENENDDG